VSSINAGAVPKKILEYMNIPGLTRENIASHLQVYYLLISMSKNKSLTKLSSSFSYVITYLGFIKCSYSVLQPYCEVDRPFTCNK